ncbi:P27 family phage terminase small subunit [Streptomyces coelicoflavus]|uniref:P27 family phage terminase small subunit n=1 Tax=Streptomyces coelicoflavus TaxID=285562 RepID=A0A7K3PEQ6_9ACTN|nr:P27 family phage terminase small subunit [Streptomyces coelicoflavus]NEB08476.1 P27 family phage terminase small subunit [Streptomyces coelicoflavus]
MSNKISDEFRRSVLAVFDPEPYELTTLDRACAVLDQIEELENDVRQRGVIVRGVRGSIYPNPSLKELRAAEASFLAIVRALGLQDADMAPGKGSAAAAARAMNRARWGVRSIASA